MTFLTRKLLLVACAIIFILVAPALVLYAIGYRPNGISAPSVVGVLLIESEPRKADILVDGKAAGRSPKAISNIPIGQASLRLEKEGYGPWQKTVAVESTRTSEFNNIRLFPSPIPQTILARDVAQFALAPNRQLLSHVSGSGILKVTDTTGEEIVPARQLPAIPQRMLWSPDSNSILLGYPSQKLEVLTIGDPTQPPQPIQPSVSVADIAWDLRVPGRLVILSTDGSLAAYSTGTQTMTPLARGIRTFAVSARRIFVVTYQNKIQALNLQGRVVDDIAHEFQTPVARLLLTPTGNMAVQFADTSLVVLEEEESAPLPVATQAQATGWSPDGQMLYVQPNNNELVVYNVTDERAVHIPLRKSQLVISLSRPLTDPQWFAGGHHLIYQVGDEIFITEIDTRDHPINTAIDTTNLGEAHVMVGEEGETLFYLKQQGGQKSLIRADLSLETKKAAGE